MTEELTKAFTELPLNPGDIVILDYFDQGMHTATVSGITSAGPMVYSPHESRNHLVEMTLAEMMFNDFVNKFDTLVILEPTWPPAEPGR